MGAYPAEYYAKLYMEQPWGSNGATNAMRSLLKEIRAELHNPLRRCPACEEPGYGTLLEWPTRTHQEPKLRDRPHLRRRYVLCALCGNTQYWPSPTGRTGSMKVLSKETQLEVCRLYMRGLNSTVLAQRYYVARTTITATLRDHGVPVRHRGGSPALKRVSRAELRLIHDLYEVKGLSQKEIAQTLKIPASTLQSRIETMRREGWLPDAKSHAKNVALRKKLDQRAA